MSHHGYETFTKVSACINMHETHLYARAVGLWQKAPGFGKSVAGYENFVAGFGQKAPGFYG